MKVKDMLIKINDLRCEVAGVMEFEVLVGTFFGFPEDLEKIEVDEEEKTICLK